MMSIPNFYNPNSAEGTANYIAKIYIGTNQAKIDQVLRETAEKWEHKAKRARVFHAERLH